jgi:hypothetical protein
MVGYVEPFVDGPEMSDNYFPFNIWQFEPKVVTPTINGKGSAAGTEAATGSGTVILDTSYLVDMYCVIPGATIYHTLDGSIPPNSSTSRVFTVEFLVAVTTLGGPITITAVATVPGCLPSLLATLKLSPPTSIAG